MASIIFKNIRFKNLLSSGNSFIEVNLNNQGKTLIFGSNGDGKTTIIEALVFVLFGKSYKKLTKEQQVNSTNKKDCVVELNMVVDEVEYKIVRGISPNIFRIEKDGVLVNQESSVVDYQKLFESSILRMNYASFLQFVVVGVTNYTPFLQLTTQKRREFVDHVLGVDTFTKMNKILKEDNSNLDTQIRETSYAIDVLERAINNRDAELAEEIETLEGELVVLNQSIVKLQENTKGLAEARTTRAETNSKISRHNKTLATKESEMSRIKSDAMDLKNRNYSDVGAMCSECGSIITGELIESHKTSDKERLEKLKVEYKNYVDSVNNIKVTIQKLNTEYSEHDNLVSRMESLASQIPHIQSNIRQKTDRIKLLRSKVGGSADVGEYNTHKENLVALRNDRYVGGIAASLLSDSGIKSYVIDSYVPIINDMFNEYLNRFDFKTQIKFDSSFDETIVGNVFRTYSYHSFSMGERMRVDLAMLFTWREISRLRGNGSCNIIIFDEILDASLDRNGVDDFQNILDKLGVGVYIISHNSENYTEHINHKIQVSKVSGFTQYLQQE